MSDSSVTGQGATDRLLGQYVIGNDNEQPLHPSSPTTNFKLNHIMVRIQDPARSLHFYVDLLGMRTVFTMDTGPFTIYYLGYPQIDEHKIDMTKFGQDTLANLTGTLGLLELYHIHGSENKPPGLYSTGNQPPALGFGHLGFTVPDVLKTVQYLTSHGVEVVKDLGVATRVSIPLSVSEAERGLGLDDLHPSFQKVFEQIAFVRDPDGYLIELVPQKMK
ncbi:hypothetical protein PENSTE_c052G00870 [Penicillium steckii]|uniref:VOC domain-containing protein n=1 Tax=Penicillium steckii TaxID=303698 RepID=A0A1V6SIN4_9EURO|nr:hypothetical protein PENSTE_c052G00870 [Penicillium steckii]